MRKEASMDQWRALYDITDHLKQMEPWNLFFDTDLLCIQSEDAENIVFVSIMGRAGQCFGYTVYEGMEGLADFDMIATADHSGLPMDYLMYEQSSLCCYWGDREEVPPPQKKNITALGRKYRGRGQWPYFQSYKRRYAPFTPDAREVDVMIRAIGQAIALVEEMNRGQLKANFDAGDALWRIADPVTGQWRSEIAPLPYRQKTYPMLDLADEVLKKRLQLKPMIDVCLIMEFAYLNGAVKDDHEDRPVNPLLFIVADEDQEMILSMNMLSPKDKEEEIVLGFFVNYVLEYGRPDMIRARNPWILTALDKLCEDCDIAVEEENMELMDMIIADLRDRLGS